MSNRAKPQVPVDLREREEADQRVEAEAGDDSAWEAPIEVKRSGTVSLSIPQGLAARAAFLARLHHESDVAKWMERVIRDRVEMEESAYSEVKRKLAC